MVSSDSFIRPNITGLLTIDIDASMGILANPTD